VSNIIPEELTLKNTQATNKNFLSFNVSSIASNLLSKLSIISVVLLCDSILFGFFNKKVRNFE
jgi:hypothetical protein